MDFFLFLGEKMEYVIYNDIKFEVEIASCIVANERPAAAPFI